MEFIDFARAHGLIVHDIDVGRWVRVPTVDHPRSRNGAYKYMGDVGFVQNHATQVSVSIWKPESHSEIRIDPKVVLQKTTEEDRKRALERKRAADKAQRILDASELATHPYLKRKGFEELKGNVWNDILIIQMAFRGIPLRRRYDNFFRIRAQISSPPRKTRVADDMMLTKTHEIEIVVMRLSFDKNHLSVYIR